MIANLAERTARLRAIRDELFSASDSPLYEYRQSHNYFPVIGEGSHAAAIMLVGEAPGENEAKTGRPFCGASGKVLDQLLAHINLPRAEVYVTNIVKDRPPGNRDPLPSEIAYYAPFLDRQIEIIEPRVIATLGRHSMKYLMSKFNLLHLFEPISRLHGQVFPLETSYGPARLAPLYHPAVAVYNRNELDTLKADMKNLLL